MGLEVYLGRKFNGSHQIAILLIRHLGENEALNLCRRNGWFAVDRAIREQRAIVTRPAD